MAETCDTSAPPSTRRRPTSTALPLLSLGAVVGLVYATCLLLMARDGLWVIDNTVKFVQVQSIALSDFQAYNLYWPGLQLDPLGSHNPLPPPFTYFVNGKLYAQYSPVFALVSTWPWRMLGSLGLYVWPLLAGVLTAVAAGGLAGAVGLGRAGRTAAVLLTGLATPIWFYSLTFWEHTLATCLTTFSVLLMARFLRDGRWRDWIGSAVLAGLAIYFRDELYLWAVLQGVLGWWFSGRRWQVFVVFGGVSVLAVVPLWCFQGWAIGQPLGHHFAGYSPWADYWIERGPVLRKLLANFHQQLGWSLTLAVPFLALWLVRPRLQGTVGRGVVLAATAWGVLAGVVTFVAMATSGGPMWYLLEVNSVFAAAPLLILGLLHWRPDSAGTVGVDASLSPPPPTPTEAVPVARAHAAVRWLALLYVVAYVVIVPLGNAQGVHWGCRFVLSVYPLLTVLAAETLVALWGAGRAGGWRRLSRGLAAALVVVTIGLQLYSVHLLRLRKDYVARVNRAVLAAEPEVVIATSWYAAQEQHLTYGTKLLLLAPDPEAANRLIESAYLAGHQEVLMLHFVPHADMKPPPRVQLISDEPLGFVSTAIETIHLRPAAAPPPSNDGLLFP